MPLSAETPAPVSAMTWPGRASAAMTGSIACYLVMVAATGTPSGDRSRSGLLVLLALAACSRAGDQSESKTWQDQPPPKQVEAPAGLSIAGAIGRVVKLANRRPTP